MKRLLILIFFNVLSNINTTVWGQTVSDIDSLICQEWRQTYYEADGLKLTSPTYQESNRMIFHSDHKVESIESDKIKKGIWKYNPPEKILTVTDNSTNQIINMKVIRISCKEVVLEFKDNDGILKKVHFEAISKK